MIKGYTFDLGNTLIDNRGFSFYGFFKELEKRLDIFLTPDVLYKLINKLLNRKNKEISFQKILKVLGVLKFSSDLEYDVCLNTSANVLFENAKTFINDLLKNGIKVFVLSNSLFSGDTLRKLLVSRGISDKIVVCSSTDFNYRKPSKVIFQRFNKFVENGYNIKTQEMVYIGDNYINDCLGPKPFFFKTLQYSFSEPLELLKGVVLDDNTEIR